MWIGDAATVTMVACNLTFNFLYGNSNDSATISINAVTSGGLGTQLQDTVVRMEQC
jgi:hypothetical protein